MELTDYNPKRFHEFDGSESYGMRQLVYLDTLLEAIDGLRQDIRNLADIMEKNGVRKP